MFKKNCFDIVQRIISGKNKMRSKYDQTLNLNMKNPSEVNPNEPMFKQYVSNKNMQPDGTIENIQLMYWLFPKSVTGFDARTHYRI